jgi:serine protease Do
VPIEIIREGKKKTINATLMGRDKAKTDKSTDNDNDSNADKSSLDMAEKLGIKAGTITKELRDQLGLSNKTKGVVILEVASNSQAAQEGLAKSDIILEINRTPIESVKDFKKALKNVKKGDSILFLLQREGNTFFKAFKIR